MDSGPTDSSGTDDDDIPPLPERPIRGLRTSGNGRGPASYGRSMPSVPSYEEQLRKLETEAYCSVLSAFAAQSEAISWTKERLMCDLRKELRVTDEQHSNLLSRVFQDTKIMHIRERRQQIEAAVPQQPPPPPVPMEDRFGSVGGPQPRKKQKTAHVSVPPAPPLPPASTSPPPKPTPVPSLPPPQPAKRMTPSTGRGKKGKQLAVPPSGMGAAKATTSGASTGSAEPGVALPADPYIGRRLRTRWPEDGLIYEAKITDYNPETGMHSLLYETDTSTEWVVLKEIMSSKDFAWIDGPAGVSLQKGVAASSPGLPQSDGGGRGAAGRGMRRSAGTMTRAAGTEPAPIQTGPPGGRGRFQRGGAPTMPARGPGKAPGPKGGTALPMENGVDGRRVGGGGASGNIRVPKGEGQMLEELAKKVESLDDVQDIKELERAKQMFKDREEQLRKALAECSESSDDDESG